MPSDTKQERFPWGRFLQEHDASSAWPTATAAAEYLGVTPSILGIWRRKGCPLLGGRRPKTEPFLIHKERNAICFCKVDLDKIRAAREALPTTSHSLKDEWITKEQARAITGYSERGLAVVINHGSPFFPTRRIATQKQTAVRRNGWPYTATLVCKKDIEELVRNRNAVGVPANRMTIKQAAKALGVSTLRLRGWIARGCPFLDGREMLVETKHVMPEKQAVRHPVLHKLLSTAEVEQIREEIRRRTAQSHTDHRGTWLTIQLATQRYKNAHRALLYLYQGKPCPQLDWEPLRADWFPRVLKERRRYREMPVLMYLEDDLKRLKPAVMGPRRREERPRLEAPAVATVEPRSAPFAPATAAEPTREAPTPAEAGNGQQPANRGGRPRSPKTEEVYKFCYEAYTGGKKLSQAMSEAQRLFGKRAPQEEANVRLYAKRYAQAESLPCNRPEA